MLGHTSAVKCLAAARNTLQLDFIISASDNGFDYRYIFSMFYLKLQIVYSEMCCWDLIDGLCVESEKMVNIHCHMQVSFTS